ncbi:MAG TPA: MCP four helix bundle domain-containing protein, partial [Capillimicrobium sp.]
MSILRRLSLRTKLLALAGCLLALLATVAVVSITKLNGAADDANTIYAERLVPLQEAEQASNKVTDLQRLLLRGFIVDASQQGDIDSSMAANSDAISTALGSYAKRSLPPAERQTLEQLNREVAAYADV